MRQVLTTEAIAECIGNGSIWEAESNAKWLDVVSTPAPPEWDLPFTVERINFWKKTVKAFQLEFDEMGEVLFVRATNKLVVATDVRSHLAQSSSASRFTASA